MSRRAEEFLPGPPDLRSLFKWPDQVTNSLTHVERMNLDELLARRIEVYSDYSGLDSYRHALGQVQISYNTTFPGKWPKSAVEFSRACDNDATCQKVLIATSREMDKSSSCVFVDICDRLSPGAARFVEACVPAEDLSQQEKMEAYQSMMSWLIDNRAWAYSTVSRCLVHEGDCFVHPAFASPSMNPNPSDDGTSAAKRRKILSRQDHSPGPDAPTSPMRYDGLSGPLYVNTSGMTCVGWSTVGTHAAHAHNSEKANNILLCERRHFAELGVEHAFFGECTVHFPVAKLEKALHNTHILLSITCGPELLGWPVKRPRMLCVGLSRKYLKWVGGDDWPDRFREKYFRSCVVPGSILLSDSAAARWRLYQELALIQGNRMTEDELQALSKEEFLEAMLPSYQLTIRKRYHKLQAEHSSLGGCFIADIEQNPSTGASASADVPCLLTHGTLMLFEELGLGSPLGSNERPTIFTALEHLTCQGCHLSESTTSDFPALAIAGILNGLSPRVIKKLAGNAVHFHMVAAWMMFVLSNVKRIPQGASDAGAD